MFKILSASVILAVVAFNFVSIDARLLLEKIDVEANAEYLDMSVNLHKKGEHMMFDNTAELKKELHGKIIVYIDVFKANGDDFKPVFQLSGQNVCDHFEGTLDSAILTTIFDQLGKFGNMPKACPIKPGPYNLKDVLMKEDTIPAMVPGGQYRIILKVMDENDGAKMVYKNTVLVTISQS